jgi:TonB family protein
MTRWGIVLALVFPASAQAFCGFYVSGADAEIFNNASMVVLMREGNVTVLSMQNDYQGPPEDFAMVVPVPQVLREENVRTLPREVFERVERLSSPRLVEYWEQDPCDQTIGLGAFGTIGTGSGYGRGGGMRSRGAEVVVEAEFAVGEYDIVILSASDSSALETWLRDNEYNIPEGAADTLRPYVEAGTKFFVAKVDVERVTFTDGRAVLSPLRVHYTSEELALPIRLGLLNSSGTQDLIVHILAANQRYDVANRPNVTIPTNLDVDPTARERFGEFYAALFDRTVERNPGAVVTEYAWQATNCDPCPPDAMMRESDVATLGADVAFPGQVTADAPEPVVPNVRYGAVELQGGLSAEVVRRVNQRHINEVRFCYEQGLSRAPDAEGRVVLRYTIAPAGVVKTAEVASSTVTYAQIGTCLTQAVRRWQYPAPEGGGVVTVSLPITLSRTGGAFFGAVNPVVSSLVLTRLHLRYGPDDLDSDLVFRAAEPIVGGREWRGEDGELEEGSRPDSANNFQGRYAIRHPWEGPIECESPQRGIWGGPPEGQEAPAVRPATNVANAARGGIELASFVRTDVPALGIEAAEPAAPEAEEAQETEGHTIGAAPEEEGPAAQVDPSGCGCRAAPSRGAWSFALIAIVMWRRRAR